MAGSSFACDPSGWQVADALDGEAFGLESGFVAGSQNWFDDFNVGRSQSANTNALLELDLGAINATMPANPPGVGAIDGGSFANEHQLSDLHGLAAPCDLEEANFNAMCLPAPEGDLRSTHQPEIERALYMNDPANPAPSLDGTFSHAPFMSYQLLNRSPSLAYCSSPETNNAYETEGDAESASFNFYGLPDMPSTPAPPNGAVTQPKQRASAAHNWAPEEGDLTPLEMPDGSTRLTANWLPVDPEGGFVIAEPGVESAANGEMSDGFDTEMLSHAKDAFISVESTMSAFDI
ncbi:hypothetical protein PHISP_00472 [Aspergillus sp. HF37]|nr:hypothetical protein PHISP_00472 [Aspergillus sp. HF37]